MDSSNAPTRLYPTSTPSYPSIEQSRFLPGTVLIGRYRIVGLLGKGGMGEVYRADDLKLGQPVALKFLPAALTRDETRQALFHNEVKLARSVSHPSVARVYDVGEAENQPFLSMEYIDGEDLADLLRRVGRLPKDRAIRMARQLCAGLAAAHEQGIIHRDLKPANVLVDGRGHAKITDFGLASVAETLEGKDHRVGTPAYMAPEQLAGEQASIRSDIYSLGLVLYELFTGEPAFKAPSPAELQRMQTETSPASPSSFVEGFDAAVESVILRCLDHNPVDRPASALAVAAGLPGGDPLAAALAAGETPSPELVAAAGQSVDVKRWLSWTCLAFVLVGLPVVTLLSDRLMLPLQNPPDIPPAVLQARARDLIQNLGYAVPPGDSAFGFQYDNDYISGLNSGSGIDWPTALAGNTPFVRFWYRQSPDPLVGNPMERISRTNPPPLHQGMMEVILDTDGRLVSFSRVTTDDDPGSASAGADWGVLFEAAGISQEDYEPVDPDAVPPSYADQRLSWKGPQPGWPDLEARIDAASLGGRATWFAITPAWHHDPAPQTTSQAVFGITSFVVFLGLLLAGGLLARWNARQGRGDHRGARRLSLYFGSLSMITWALTANHEASFGEFAQFAIALAFALLFGSMVYIVYLAIEPFVRRRWPDILISWTRLLDGKWRDPLVGRDLLLGAALGIALAGLDQALQFAQGFFSTHVRFSQPDLGAWEGVRLALGQLVSSQFSIVILFLSLISMILFRTLLRRTWAALLVTIFLITFFSLANPANQGLQIVFIWFFWGALIGVLMRYGILAATVAFFLHSPLAHYMMTADLGAWYGTQALLAVLITLAVALYGFFTSFAGKPLFSAAAFEDA